jgi:putative phage-type endonuclease
MEQGSPEWFAERCGKVTASRVADVIAKTKTGYSTSRAKYMSELIVERLTGSKTETFQSSAMAWGTNTEPQARVAYQSAMGVLVDEIGFVPHPTIEGAGCSPDGLIDDLGMVEIKCPTSQTHLDNLLSAELPAQYKPQVQWQMACAARDWVDFVSFDPRMPEDMQIMIVRVDRDDKFIGEMEKEVVAFLGELEDRISKIKQKVKK